MAAYEFKPAFHTKADANEVGKQFEELENTVGLTAKTVLDANREEGTLLHEEFEWDDSVAAENFRLEQARTFIRMICLVPEETNTEEERTQPVRAFFKLPITEVYESTSVIIKSEDKRAELLKQAISELKAFERKYNSLAELTDVFNAISKIAV